MRASGAASRAWTALMPVAMIPSSRLPSRTWSRAARLVPGRDLLHLAAQSVVRRLGVGRDHHPGGDVVLEVRLRSRCGGLPWPHHRLGMADAGGQPQDHRDLPALGQIEGEQRVVVGLLRVDGLEHRRRRRAGVVPVVLLVLARRHPRVVRGHDDEPALDVRVGRREQRVRRDVEPDVLHRDQRARAGEGGAQRHLHSDLLVRRPLGMPAELVEVFEDLGRRRAGVAGAEPHAGVEGGEGDRLVAAEELSVCAHVRRSLLRPGEP